MAFPSALSLYVIPAHAGIHGLARRGSAIPWIPAFCFADLRFAGMTVLGGYAGGLAR